MKKIITEELGYMKYLLGYTRGVVISEQTTPYGVAYGAEQGFPWNNPAPAPTYPSEVAAATAAATAAAEPEPPAVAFNYSGNWRRLIGVTRSDSVRPNPFTEHEDVVEADDEAIFTPRTPRDMVINMIVEPDSPVAVAPQQPQQQPNVSHTMHFD